MRQRDPSALCRGHCGRPGRPRGTAADGEDYFLYLGRRLAWLGLEHDTHVLVPLPALADAVSSVGPTLVALGHTDPPALHLQFEGQH